jgi:hypothetical protein
MPTKNRPVPEINRLLTGRAGGTIAIMVCKGHEYRTPASAGRISQFFRWRQLS